MSKLLSLFDGSGGFPLAASICGITPIACSEIEPYPIAVTCSRFPNMKHYGDVSKLKGDEVEPVDVITFGSPCQDMSVAGKRAGLDGSRSSLFYEAVRIIKEMRLATNGVYPRFAVWENVPGAFSSNGGEDFQLVLEEMCKICEPAAEVPAMPKGGWPYADVLMGDGWSVAYRTFDAQHWGVPQRRRRIYLVADFAGECAGEILFKRDGLRGDFAEGRTPWQGAAADAPGGSGASYTLKIRSGCAGGGKGALVQENLSATLSTNNDQYLFQSVGTFQNTGVGWWNESDIAETIRTPCGGDATKANIAVFSIDPLSSNSMKSSNPHSGFHETDIAKCLDTSDGNPSKNQGGMVVCEALPFDTTQVTSPQNGNNPQWGDPCHPLAATGHPPTIIAGKAYAVENHPADSRVSLDDTGKVQTLTSRMGTGGGNVPMVMESVICLQGNGIDRADTAGCNGNGWKENQCYTLNTIDRPAVCYGIGNGQSNQSFTKEQTGTLNCMHDQQIVAYGVDCRNFSEEKELNGTIQSTSYHNLNSGNVVRQKYIVRRLTPTECARLQGFTDAWGDIDILNEMTDEEALFWQEVQDTYNLINGKQIKKCTKEQLIKWHNKLHTDSAEYKMWGNGIALPNALYVMQGIQEVLNGQSKDAGAVRCP